MHLMNSMLKGASALGIAAALGLATPAGSQAHAQEIEIPDWVTDDFTSSRTKAFDVDRLVDLMPDGVKLDMDEAEFDEDTGAMVLDDVEISFSGMGDLAIEIDELRIWGLDLDYLETRMAGDAADSSGRIARRIEAGDVELVGLESAMADFMDAYMNAAQGTMDGMMPEDFEDEAFEDEMAAAFDMEITDYEVSFGDLVIEDLRLLPWEMVAADAEKLDAGWAELMPFLQNYAAWSRVFSFDGLAIDDLTFGFVLDQDGVPFELEYDIEVMFYEGYRGGDQALFVADDMTGSAVFTDPEIGDFSMDMEFSVDSYVIRDMKLNKVMGYLARGEMPPKTETDLMSLGVWETGGESYFFNGEPFYSTGSTRIALDDWHWLMPARASVSVSDFSIDFDGYMSAISDVMEAEDEDYEDVSEMFDSIIGVLDDYGLAQPSVDYSMIWNWSPESGETSAGLAFGLDGYSRMAWLIGGILPDYEGLTDPIADDFSMFDGDMLEETFEDVFAFSTLRVELIDEGGFEKAFPLVIDMAELFRDEDDGAEFLANATPETLRGFVTGGITFGASQAGTVFPPVMDYAEELVAFIEEGGRFVIEIKPDEPIDMDALEDMEDRIEDDPEGLADYLGLKVMHDAP